MPLKNNLIILDTHIWVNFVLANELLQKREIDLIESNISSGTIFLAAISLWEIAMLAQKGRLSLTMPCHQWIAESLSLTQTKILPITPEIASDSGFLPGDFHGDPADRMIVATARMHQATLLSHDKKIAEYGKNGFVEIL